MSKKKENINPWGKIRGDWGAVNPVTKIIPNKKRKALVKPKYKGYKKGEE